MYVIKTITRELPDKRYVSHDHLWEMTAKELREAEAENKPGVEYNVIPAYLAHRYVKQGMNHSTPLWVDNGKVRYARGC
jgi:hypothetical protein